MRAEAAEDANATVYDEGPEWRVAADCPSCRVRLFVNVQPGPCETELWCFRCEKGVPVTVTGG